MARGTGAGRKEASSEYLVQSSGDEGQEHQPPHRAAHNKRYGVMYFIWLHFGLCLRQGEGKRGASGETDAGFLGLPQTDFVHTLNLITNPSLCPQP